MTTKFAQFDDIWHGFLPDFRVLRGKSYCHTGSVGSHKNDIYGGLPPYRTTSASPGRGMYRRFSTGRACEAVRS
jgi:hypothetical protein